MSAKKQNKKSSVKTGAAAKKAKKPDGKKPSKSRRISKKPTRKSPARKSRAPRGQKVVRPPIHKVALVVGAAAGLVAAVALFWSYQPAPVTPPAVVAPVAQAPEPQSQTMAAAPVDQTPASQRIAQTPIPQPNTVDSMVLQEEFTRLTGAKLGARLRFWSERLGSKSEVNRIADELKKTPIPNVEDSSPLVNTKFDCTTYVESVLALARSARAQEFGQNLVAIRYRDGKGAYLDRNHFPEADWIPNNVKTGILDDVTVQLGELAGIKAQAEQKTIDKAAWLAQQVKSGTVSRSIASAQEQAWRNPVNVSVNYIPVDDVSRVLPHVSDGLIVNFVRKNVARKPVMITHQGFLFRDGDRVMLRHASPSGKVRTEEFVSYLEKQKLKNRPWPLLGVNLNQVRGG